MEDLLGIKLYTAFTKNLIFWDEEDGLLSLTMATFQIENNFCLLIALVISESNGPMNGKSESFNFQARAFVFNYSIGAVDVLSF